MAEASFTPRVFSGIQPSGGLTLGNYLGALKRFADSQNSGVELSLIHISEPTRPY